MNEGPTTRGNAPDSFEKVRAMSFPRVVLAGHGVLQEIGSVAKTLGLPTHGIIITGPRTQELAGHRTGEILRGAGFHMETLMSGEATLEEVGRLAQETERCGGEFLVAVGGGSRIDLAKLVAFRRRIPFLSVPTVASHDGISSPRASLRGEDRETLSLTAAVPLAIVADTEVIARAPFRFLAAGCADVVSNITAVLDWRLAQRLRSEEFSSSAAALAEYAAREIMDHASLIKSGLEESVWVAIRPIIMSGIAMSMANSSRPSSGSEHLFAHALLRLRPMDVLHGEAVGIGTIMMAHLHGEDWKLVRNVLREIGAPTTAGALGLETEEIVAALVNAHTIRPERYTILGDRGLTPDAAQRLARFTGVV